MAGMPVTRDTVGRFASQTHTEPELDFDKEWGDAAIDEYFAAPEPPPGRPGFFSGESTPF